MPSRLTTTLPRLWILRPRPGRGSDDESSVGAQYLRQHNRTATTHHLAEAGVHILKVWMVDPTVVVQRLIINTGGLRPSYLGPPESFRVGHDERGGNLT